VTQNCGIIDYIKTAVYDPRLFWPNGKPVRIKLEYEHGLTILKWRGGHFKHGCGKLLFDTHCERLKPAKSITVTCTSNSDNISVDLSSIELNDGTPSEIFIDFNESDAKSLMLNILGERLDRGFTITADMTVSWTGTIGIADFAQCTFEIEEVLY